MLYLYFVYGLSFFTLGIAILVYPRRDSEFPIGRTLALVGLFGALHGIHEWTEMVALLQPTAVAVTRLVGLVCLPTSFLCLLAFGSETLATKRGSPLRLRLLIAGLCATWIIITATSKQHFEAGSIWARYLLGIPGMALAARTLLRQAPGVTRRQPSLTIYLKVAAGTFACYGIFAGLVVPDAGFFPASFINYTAFRAVFGIPVQVARTACAVTITISTISILRIFTWETHEKLRDLSLRDELTGLLNRRGFLTLGEHQFKIAKRQRRPIVLLVGDLDGLKAINDAHGHGVGDGALAAAADILKRSFRESDLVARIGGDEFAVLLVESINRDAGTTIARLEDNLAAHNSARPGDYRLAMSVGAVPYDPDSAVSFDQLIARADEEMYGHKKRKRAIKRSG